MSDNVNWGWSQEHAVWREYQHPGVLVRIADDLARVHIMLIAEMRKHNVLVPVHVTDLLQSADECARKVIVECKRQEDERRAHASMYHRLIKEGLCP